MIETPEAEIVLAPVGIFQPERSARRLELALRGIELGIVGKLRVDRLETAGDRIVDHHEIARRRQGHIKIHPQHIALADGVGLGQQAPFAAVLAAIFAVDLDAGIGVAILGIGGGISETGGVIEAPGALTGDGHLPFAPDIRLLDGMAQRDLRIAEILEDGVADRLVAPVCRRHEVRLVLLVKTAVIGQGIGAEHIFLGVLPMIAAAAALGDGAHHLEGRIGGDRRPVGQRADRDEGRQHGAILAQRAVEHAGIAVIDLFVKDELPATFRGVVEHHLGGVARHLFGALHMGRGQGEMRLAEKAHLLDEGRIALEIGEVRLMILGQRR